MSITNVTIKDLFTTRLGANEYTGVEGTIPKEYINSENVQLVTKLSVEGYEDQITFKPLPNGDLAYKVPLSIL